MNSRVERGVSRLVRDNRSVTVSKFQYLLINNPLKGSLKILFAVQWIVWDRETEVQNTVVVFTYQAKTPLNSHISTVIGQSIIKKSYVVRWIMCSVTPYGWAREFLVETARKHEHWVTTTHQAGGGNAMVWGIFQWYALSPLIRVSESLNSTTYLKIVADQYILLC